MKNLKIRTKLILGFGVLVFIMLGTLGTVKVQMDSQNTVMSRTVNLRAPTIQNSIQMLNGMNLSLAGLRGWMLLGDTKFQDDRTEAWAIIDRCISEMTVLSQNWTDPENVARFEELKGVLIEFRSAQQEIDDIAQEPENLPATQLLLVEAAPRAETIITAITEMIDLELARPSTDENRIPVLGSMANFRGAMAMSLANVRAYLLSGQEVFVERYNRFTEIRQTSQRELEGFASSLNSSQRAAFQTLTDAILEFEPLPPQMFEIRGGEQWNVANYWLAQNAAPKAARLVTLVEGMVVSQTGLMETDKQGVLSSISTTNLIMVILFAVSLILALVISLRITAGIAGPVVKLTGAATQLSLGQDINEPLVVDAGGEVGELAEAMERLRSSVVVLTEMTSSGDMDDDLDL